MEKGTLVVKKTKKGYQAEIHFVKKNGKKGVLPVGSWKPEDDSYNGVECLFERNKGLLISLRLSDGTELYKKKASFSAPDSGSEPSKKGVMDSYLPDKTCLPGDTKAILNETGFKPDNFFLKFHKAARFEEDRKSGGYKFLFFKRDRRKGDFTICKEYGGFNFQDLVSRVKIDANRLFGDNNVRVEIFAPEWRLIQGLGNESVYEVSMTLHHVYGVPYIPASSLKGIVRSWIVSQVFDSKEELAIQDQIFCDWFGCPAELLVERENGKKVLQKSYYREARKGEIVFFDVFPLGAPNLEVDIMNPHYGDYYADTSAKVPPADYFNPVPVPFLTVVNTKFQFILASKDSSALSVKLIGGKDVVSWLKDTLKRHGIGAKTSVGYGFMKE